MVLVPGSGGRKPPVNKKPSYQQAGRRSALSLCLSQKAKFRLKVCGLASYLAV